MVIFAWGFLLIDYTYILCFALPLVPVCGYEYLGPREGSLHLLPIVVPQGCFAFLSYVKPVTTLVCKWTTIIPSLMFYCFQNLHCVSFYHQPVDRMNFSGGFEKEEAGHHFPEAYRILVTLISIFIRTATVMEFQSKCLEKVKTVRY